jgi:hypothetical protein
MTTRRSTRRDTSAANQGVNALSMSHQQRGNSGRVESETTGLSEPPESAATSSGTLGSIPSAGGQGCRMPQLALSIIIGVQKLSTNSLVEPI